MIPTRPLIGQRESEQPEASHGFSTDVGFPKSVVPPAAISQTKLVLVINSHSFNVYLFQMEYQAFNKCLLLSRFSESKQLDCTQGACSVARCHRS